MTREAFDRAVALAAKHLAANAEHGPASVAHFGLGLSTSEIAEVCEALVSVELVRGPDHG